LIEVYTDGSCLGNPGTGGWAFLILREIGDINHFGYQQNTTNNQMELTAAINALEFIKENDEVTLFTDSSYVKNGITSWIVNWKKNNWKNSQKKEIKNKDLWIKLDFLNSNRNVTWKWVKAHDVNEHNNRVDLLAREAAEKLIKSSFDGV
jgi:ribonuclease HI|tara:strand:+ start:239 stop:688 length:450 start_codon:yes stop_codon:yes gene_type:complete